MGAKMPKSLSDRGPQMRSKTIRRFFYDLGITQMFARPRTPADNATIESFFATIKGERLYYGTYSNSIELISDADAFVAYYNEDRLHMGIDFVTPAEKHDGRADAIIAASPSGNEARKSATTAGQPREFGGIRCWLIPRGLGSKALTQAESPPQQQHSSLFRTSKARIPFATREGSLSTWPTRPVGRSVQYLILASVTNCKCRYSRSTCEKERASRRGSPGCVPIGVTDVF